MRGMNAGIRAIALALALLLPGRAVAEEVVIFAAASLTDALREIGKGYEATSRNHLIFNFGASNDLARQIRAGAPADVFFSADLAQMEGLEREGLVRRAERLAVLTNLLTVLVTGASMPGRPHPRHLHEVKYLARVVQEAA